MILRKCRREKPASVAASGIARNVLVAVSVWFPFMQILLDCEGGFALATPNGDASDLLKNRVGKVILTGVLRSDHEHIDGDFLLALLRGGLFQLLLRNTEMLR